MTDYTPDPWFMLPSPQDVTAWAVDTDKAYARLIAAAPDMLAALEVAHRALRLAYLKSSNASQAAESAIDCVVDAIAKAKGV